MYIKELEEDRNGKKQHQAQKKELEKLARENEELKERLKDFSSRESVSRPLTTTERSVLPPPLPHAIIAGPCYSSIDLATYSYIQLHLYAVQLQSFSNCTRLAHANFIGIFFFLLS